jgi:hypothetical protein
VITKKEKDEDAPDNTVLREAAKFRTRPAFPRPGETNFCSKKFFRRRALRGWRIRSRNSGGVPVGLAPADITRFVAGTLAMLWAVAGLATMIPSLAAIGPSAGILIAILANVALVAGAALALANVHRWRSLLLTALLLVTIDRIASAIGSGAGLTQGLSAVVAFAAIAGATMITFRRAA